MKQIILNSIITFCILYFTFPPLTILAESKGTISLKSTKTDNKINNIKKLKKTKEPKELEELKEKDIEITNTRMRAKMGSLSKWSIYGNVFYIGGKITDPFSDQRPNPNNYPDDYLTYLSGGLSVRYRINKKSSIGLGSNIAALTPFHGIKRFEMKNPHTYLSIYHKLLNDLQMGHTFTFSAKTEKAYLDIGNTADIAYTNTLVFPFSTKKIAMGFSSIINYSFFESYNDNNKEYFDYGLSLCPYVEFTLNDYLTLRSVLGIVYLHKRKESEGELTRMKTYQTIGLGIKVTPIINIYTYMQTYHNELWSKSASISISTIFSIF